MAAEEHRIRVLKNTDASVSSSKKRKNEDNELNEQPTNHITLSWPKFLMAISNNEKTITKLSPFKLAKGINEIIF